MPVKFDAAVSGLMHDLFEMSAMAERMLEAVASSLVRREAHLLQSVYEDEKRMDSLQLKLDDRTVELIGVYTPVAADLRLLLMMPRITGALERIGDQAEKVCKHVEDLVVAEPLKPLEDLPKLAQLSRDMLRACLRAFAERSSDQAMAVLRMDVEVDAFRNSIIDELIACMERDNRQVCRALHLMTVARAFERVGDQAVDIAEATIYAVTGKDIRHLHLERAQRNGAPAPLP
ncbi:MAG: phosphate signaling complex protein PhoU [Lentisphaerae bacterium]|nr:phosphate signaling complex protein PhoU [Lentisphaerota bacterium]